MTSKKNQPTATPFPSLPVPAAAAEPQVADLQAEIAELKTELREVLTLLRAPAKGRPKAAPAAAAAAKAPRVPRAKAAESRDFDPALRVRDRFYYVTLEAPPGTYGGDPALVGELLSRNFTRLCRRASYGVVAAIAAFDAAGLALHAILRAAQSLPTTSPALANCNRTTIQKTAGEKVEYYVEGIALRPLNKGKGSFITQEVLRAAVEAAESAGEPAFVAGDEGELFAGVPFEAEVEPAKRGTFDPAALAAVYPSGS